MSQSDFIVRVDIGAPHLVEISWHERTQLAARLAEATNTIPLAQEFTAAGTTRPIVARDPATLHAMLTVIAFCRSADGRIPPGIDQLMRDGRAMEHAREPPHQA